MSREQVEELNLKISEAVRLLGKYQGDKIIAGEHALHKAIVEVECLCKQVQGTGIGKQMYGLFGPANVVWYQLLDVSRSGRPSRLRPRNRRFDDLNVMLPVKKKRRLRVLAAMLAVALETAGSALYYYVEGGGGLPYVSKHLSN